MIGTTEIKLPGFRLLVSVPSAATVLYDENAVLPTTYLKNVATLSKSSSNFAVSSSLAKIFMKTLREDRLTLLRPSEKSLNVTTGAKRTVT